MGNSSYQGKEWTAAFVDFKKDEIKNILDLGPGQGTYYSLLHKQLEGSVWHGVEVFLPYIIQFRLEYYYNRIYHTDVREFIPEQDYDLIIAGDILEHMTKEQAIELVDKMLEKTKYFLISIPIVHWPQDAINNNPYEIHIKDDWSDEEMRQTFGDKIINSFAGSHIGVYVLNGKL